MDRPGRSMSPEKVRGDNLISESEMWRGGMTCAFTERMSVAVCEFIRRGDGSPRNRQPLWQLWRAADSLRRWEITHGHDGCCRFDSNRTIDRVVGRRDRRRDRG